MTDKSKPEVLQMKKVITVPGYFTAAGPASLMAALVLRVSAVLYSSKWTLGFDRGLVFYISALYL